jgi:HEAT repeat protein
MGLLDIIALALSASSLATLGVLVLRRSSLARREARRRELEDGLKPIAMELLHAGAEPPSQLDARQREALADLLGRYAKALRGPTHDRIVDYFDREGTGARAVAVMTGARAGWRRATAAFRLGDIGPASAATALIAALKDPDRDVRIAAARSLGRLRAPEAAAELLTAAADRRVPPALVRWALLQIGPAALPRLLPLVTDDSERARTGVVQLVGLLGGPGEAALVRERLTDDSSMVRAQAARALGRIGGRRDLPALRRASWDRVPAVRAAAAEALGQLRDHESLPTLALRAGNDQFDVARACARAVAAIDPAEVLERARATGAVHLLEAADLIEVL